MKKSTQLKLVSLLPLLTSLACTDVKLSNLDQVAAAPVVMKHGKVIVDNFCPALGQHFVDFFIHLRSLRIRGGKVLADWSRDGIPDVDKPALNLNKFLSDQSGTGFGNLLLYRAGISAADSVRVHPCADQTQATIPGWLTDCQRDFLQLGKVVDSAGRGIPDDLAVWFGLDLLDPDAGNQDIAGDGYTNLNKIKLNATLAESVSADTIAVAPVYNVAKTFNTGNTCYSFTVSNIALPPNSNGNLVVPVIVSADSQNNFTVKAPNILFPPSAADGTTMEFQYGSF